MAGEVIGRGYLGWLRRWLGLGGDYLHGDE